MIYRNVNHKVGMKISRCFLVLFGVLCVSFGSSEIVWATSVMHYHVPGMEDGGQGRHMIDIDVSVLDGEAMPDSESTSEFKISLTNTGTEPLTEFEGSLEEPETYELFCEEEGVRYKLLSHEAGEEESEKKLDKTTTLPDTLKPGDSITIYAVRLPECDAGKTEEIFVVYTEETGQYEVPLTVSIQGENQEKTEANGEEDSEILSEKKPEFNQDNKEEKDIELKSDDEIRNEARNEDTNEDDPADEKEPKEKDDEEINNEENGFIDSDFICEVKSIDHTNGAYIGNIFFVAGDSQYIVHFSPESTVKELNYQIGTFGGTVSVTDGFAVMGVPQNISGNLEIFCMDQNQDKVVICREYVVNENISPEVHYEKVEKDGKSYAVVTVEDYGDVISGLKDCSVYVDGDLIDIAESSVLGKVTILDGCEVVSSRQYTIFLENGKTHNFEVTAKDYAGNTIKKNFSFEKAEKEIVNVVLPTSFNILALPDDQGNQLYGEDIVLCNKSDFPVQVDVTSTQVQVDHTISDKNSQMNPGVSSSAKNGNIDLSLQLLQADKSAKSIKLAEGNTENVASFVLAEKNSATDFEDLCKSEVREVNSSDYAVLNIRGTMGQNPKDSYENDDLHVKIVFRFNKLGETD